MKSFIDTLKDTRLRLGLEQKEFAERLGVTRSAINGWETGYRRPSANNLVRLITTEGLEESERDMLLHAYKNDIAQSLNSIPHRNGIRSTQLNEALRQLGAQ